MNDDFNLDDAYNNADLEALAALEEELVLEQDDQRKQEAQRRDDERKADDARADDLRRQDERRQDDLKAEERRKEDVERDEAQRLARQKAMDESMEFTLDDDEPSDQVEAQADPLADMKAFHQRDMERHRAEQAEKDAMNEQQQQAKESFYKGGYVDLQGNVRDRRDVEAIMANHQAQGGHRAAQQRYGLATDAGHQMALKEHGQEAASTVQEQAQENQASDAGQGTKSRVHEHHAAIKGLPDGVADNRKESWRLMAEAIDEYAVKGDSETQEQAPTDWAQQMGLTDEQAMNLANAIEGQKAGADFLQDSSAGNDQDWVREMERAEREAEEKRQREAGQQRWGLDR